MGPDHLARVQRAAEARRAAEAEYRASVAAARASGLAVAAIGKVAGVSRQAIERMGKGESPRG